LERGAHMLRVHDVVEAREVVALHRALRGEE
jgi:dihydropteroate synthase